MCNYREGEFCIACSSFAIYSPSKFLCVLPPPDQGHGNVAYDINPLDIIVLPFAIALHSDIGHIRDSVVGRWASGSRIQWSNLYMQIARYSV